jgi:hypothetical protein
MRNYPPPEQFVLAEAGKSSPNSAQKKFKFDESRKRNAS